MKYNSVDEFAGFVLNNIGKANLGNTLKITDSIDCEDGFSFGDFLSACIKKGANICKNTPQFGAKILKLCDKYSLLYHEERSDKKMTVDMFVLELCQNARKFV